MKKITLLICCFFLIQLPAQTWNQFGAAINGEADEDRSGSSVALSDDGFTMAISAIKNDGNGAQSGHVRVYAWDGSAWTQKGADLDGEAAGDESGRGLSLSEDGNILAIGAGLNDGNGPQSGHVRIFQWDGSSWLQMGADIDGEVAGDISGVSLDLAANGLRVA
ncbi:MAG: hypothetical protein KDC82_06240, partial [Bacteroidetes bacterium]|nr:hypothetical protein [Bacteroidota bacterium]